jgi:ATP-binding cassette subfamily B protein
MKRIISYIKPYAARMSCGLAIKFVGTVMDLALPWILAYIIDTVAPQKNTGLVYLWGIVMLICAAVAVLGNIIANRMAAGVARDATRIIRHDLFDKVMHLSLRQVDSLTTPSLISRLTSDTYNIHRMLGMMQRLGVRAPILLLGGITVTMMLDVKLSLVLLATLPLISLSIWILSRKGLPLYTAVQAAGDRMIRTVRDNVTGIRVIKALSKTPYETARFMRANEDVVGKETKAALVMGVTNPIMNIFLNGGLTAVILTGAYLINKGQTEAGKIIAFMTYFTIILNAMLSVNRLFIILTQSAASAKRITEVLDTPAAMDTVTSEAVKENAHIAFDRVGFSYTGDMEALTDISFSIKHGETLGVIGATGSGKSTLIALLLRLYDVSSGQIRIEGRDIRSISPHELRDMLGITFQSDAFFADTVLENVDFGRGLQSEQIEKALQCAQAWEFISEKPDGILHKLTAKAANLSGGQKQRLLIARALAGNPRILILDDASSALDYITDAKIRAAIHEHYRDTTMVIIAQRVSAVRGADRILVLDDGHMAGMGDDASLMRECDIYKETARVQMGGIM